MALAAAHRRSTGGGAATRQSVVVLLIARLRTQSTRDRPLQPRLLAVGGILLLDRLMVVARLLASGVKQLLGQ
jgi:hypothetical protein